MKASLLNSSPWWIIRPRIALLVGIGWLLLGWLMFFAVDVGNVFGSRDMVEARLNYPGLWFTFFNEGGPVELMQWACLGLAGFYMCIVGGSLCERRRTVQASFWMLMGLAVIVLLIEDAGDPRFQIRAYSARLTGSDSVGKLAEIVCLMVYAGIPLYALARFGRSILKPLRVSIPLLLGFMAYGLVGVMSAVKQIDDEIYRRMGAFVADGLAAGRLLRFDTGFHPLEHWLMDLLVEESIELFAAVMFLAAICAFVHTKSEEGPTENEATPESA